MPYKYRKTKGGKVAAIKKSTGKVAFKTTSLKKAKKVARLREMFKHMKARRKK